MHPAPTSLRLAAVGLSVAAMVVFAGRPLPGPVAAVAAAEDGREDGPAAEPRVIVEVNRNEVVSGHVQFEDDDVLVVRDLRGEVHSFSKGRIISLVRLVDPGPDGHPGTVHLRSGQSLTGRIVEDSFERVIVKVEGIPTTFKRETVSHVVLQPTVRERYEHLKATLDRDNAERHYDLCRWLVEQREYDLAHGELQELLARHEHAGARALLVRVEAQLALEQPPARAPTASPAPPEPPALDEDDLLTMEEVNLIRVFEIDFARPPRIVIRPATIERLIRQHSENKLIPDSQTERQRLFRADPLQITRLMFRLQARELYGEIEVQTEPYALNLFRQRVHNTWLQNNCATSRCHGGPGGGRLYLFRGRASDPRIRYSNLLTLERLDIEPAWPLINYDRPLDSLLIQYGLPRTLARRPHPPADGWQPAFRRTDDRLVQDAVRWIEAMLQPRPEYPIEYEPPAPPKPAAAGAP